jgi:ABC-type multidrug transport system permease subunit
MSIIIEANGLSKAFQSSQMVVYGGSFAVSVNSTDSFFGTMNFLTFPFMFTSSALFPLIFFPGWLKPVAQANHITTASNALRAR